MKEILTIILASAFVICLKAQNYEPTSTWPYLYPDFTAGTLYVNVSGEQKDGLYNIHILEGRLHFISTLPRSEKAFTTSTFLKVACISSKEIWLKKPILLMSIR